MAKIDTSKISGYAEMSAEEKVAALEGYDLQVDTSGLVRKDIYDKAASDLAKVKRELAERKSPEETQADSAKIKELEKKLAVMDLEKKYLATGYSAEDANKAANAYYDGDISTVFQIQQANIEAVKKSAAATAMKQTPPPNTGENTGGVGSTYDKQIAEAQENGNFALAAALMSKQFEETQNV